MTKSEATQAGLLAASLIPALLFAVFTPLSGTLDIKSFLGTFLIAYLFSAIATAVFGVPIFLLFRRFGIITWWSALAGGFLAGALVSIVIRLPGPPNVRDLVIDGPIAAASALVFWLIWRQGQEPPSTKNDAAHERN